MKANMFILSSVKLVYSSLIIYNTISDFFGQTSLKYLK